MSAVVAEPHPLALALDAHVSARTGEPAELADLRLKAAETFAELGFPSVHEEEWRFTNVGPIARAHLAPVKSAAQLGPEAVAPWRLAGAATRLTFVDGQFAPELSEIGPLPAGAFAGSLAEALRSRPELVVPHLGRHASFEEHAFVALNTAAFVDGAFLYLPRRAVVESPIHLLFLAGTTKTGDTTPAAFPRSLVVVDEAAQATIVETYAGPEGAVYFNGPVTEVVCGPGSVLDHYKLQRESTAAFHLATFELYQDRSSHYSLHSISLGGGLVRNDVNTKLDGEGCDSVLNGLYMVRGEQFVDHHMRVIHAKPHCTSFELFKGILEDRSRAVFNGLIHVYEGAQKTDAKQANNNLLMSEQALVNSNPRLRIFADDVRCTHGSTVGQLDDDAVFYLRSRGIGEEAARSLLTYAFASDIIERIKVPELRRDLDEYLFARLPKGEVVREAV